MSYMALKHTHTLLVILSVLFFTIRLVWHFKQSGLLQKKIVKILPHVIDTLVILSAIGLMVTLQQYPIQTPWLTEKLIAVILYIVLGVLTFKAAKNNAQRALFALGTYASILLVFHYAFSKQAFLLG